MTLEEQKKNWAPLFHALKLSPTNTKIAGKFIFEEVEDDSILNEVEPRNLSAYTSDYQREYSSRWIALLRQNQKHDKVARYIKFCWAVGKSTAIYWLEHAKERDVAAKERDFRIEVLGINAVAAMEAEKCANMDYPSIKDTEWLHELAKTQPEVLEAAQTMSGTSNNKMKVLLAGILLVSAPHDEERVKRQCEIVVQEDLSSFKSMTPKFSKEEREICVEYMEAGEANAQLPALSGGKMSAYDVRSAIKADFTDHAYTTLLGIASFFAQQYDPRARCAVRLYAKFNPIGLAEGILAAAPRDYLMENLETLCNDLPGTSTTLLLGLGHTYRCGNRDVYQEITTRYKSCVHHTIQLAEKQNMMLESRFLIKITDCEETCGKENLLARFVPQVTRGERQIDDFLCGEGSLKDCTLDWMKQIDYHAKAMWDVMSTVHRYYEKYGWDNFLCRYAAALVLTSDNCYYSFQQIFGWRPNNGQACTMEFIHSVLEKEMPLETVLMIMGRAYESIYDEDTQQKFKQAVYDAVNDMSNLEQLCHTCCKSNIFGRSVSIDVLEQIVQNSMDKEKTMTAKNALLSCVGDSSVQIQKQLEALLEKHQDWAEDYQAILLKNKKSAARLLAVQVLSSFGDTYHEVLKEALDKEKTVKVSDLIREVLGEDAELGDGPMDIEALADRMTNATSLKKIQWLLKYPLPAVRKKDGDKPPVRVERVKAILIAYCEMGRVGVSETGAKLAADLEPTDLQLLANEVFERWMEENAPSKHKWVLAFAAVFGGAVMTPKLRHAITEWPQAARGAIACEAVNALALSSDPAALMIVDGMSRKFKFRQIKKAAAQALENAAHELGIEPEELADRIVPDLGFSPEGKRVFDYGPRQFTVSLTPTLELEIKNDSGKVVKSMPAPGKTDDEAKAAVAYSEFKEMKKQIRATISAQKERLELALSALRCWDKSAWEALFVKNPIMHQFAMSLIWGVYEDNKLTDTFRYMEDGSFNTVDEDEYELSEHAKIGLVHPIELDEETLGAWKQQLEDYEITQSIQQLDRPIYHLEEDPEQRSMKRFGGKMLTAMALYGKLQKFGWYRGSVQDAGGYYEFYREDVSIGIGVELHFSGAFVAYNEDEDITVYDAVFYRSGTVERGSYVYDEPSKENIFALGEIPSRYYSEIVFQLERATSSSTKTNPDWEKEYRHN